MNGKETKQMQKLLELKKKYSAVCTVPNAICYTKYIKKDYGQTSCSQSSAWLDEMDPPSCLIGL